jgi:hypothetical protein
VLPLAGTRGLLSECIAGRGTPLFQAWRGPNGPLDMPTCPEPTTSADSMAIAAPNNFRGRDVSRMSVIAWRE